MSVLPTPPAEAANLLADLASARSVAVHLGTFAGTRQDDPWTGGLRAIALAMPGREPVFLDAREWGDALAPVVSALEPRTILGHGVRSTLLWLAVKFGCRPRKAFCTRTAAWLLAAGSGDDISFPEVTKRLMGTVVLSDDRESDWGGFLLTDGQIRSALDQVAFTHDLQSLLSRQMAKAGLQRVCDLEMALLPVVARMEEYGLAVSRDLLEAHRDRAEATMQEAASHLVALLKSPGINVSSPTQITRALARCGIKVKGTDEAKLRAADDGLIIPAILDFRGKEKVFQQAVTLLAAIQADGRIHARFEPTGADTGRFSCHSPNLQAIGRGDIRACFVAPPGRSLVVADYSQIEMRVAAALANEERMIAAYKRGDDLHTLTAAAILRKPPAEIVKEDRQIAKSANFGLLYGQGAKGLVAFARQAYGVTLTIEQALAIRTRFFSAYPALAQWHADCTKLAESGLGEIRTALGRRRLINPAADRWQRFTALINAPVQGGCADGLKSAMVRLAAALPPDAQIVSTVHDELLIECSDPAPVADLTRDILRSAMSDLYPQVNIEVDVHIRPAWQAAR